MNNFETNINRMKHFRLIKPINNKGDDDLTILKEKKNIFLNCQKDIDFAQSIIKDKDNS